MTSSNDAEVRPLPMQQLRHGGWTRWGTLNVLDDPVTEEVLGPLAARVRSAAEAQGFAHGWSAGRREALEEVRVAADQEAARAEQQWCEREEQRQQEHRQALTALTDALADARRQLADVCEQVEQKAVTLAYEVVEAVLQRELSAAPAADLLHRTLALLPPDGAVAVRCHPGSFEAEHVAMLTARGVAVREDSTMAAHDVIVELADGAAIDARIGAALSRLQGTWEP